MTNKQQTAVQWLLSQIFYMDNDFHAELLNSNELNQALEMERKQITDAYKEDQFPCLDDEAEQYFINTYQTEP